MRWVGHVASTGVKIDAKCVLVGKPKRRRPPGRPMCRLVDIITDIQDTGWGRGMDFFESGKGTVVGSFEHSNEPSGSTICEQFID
jgi:hypothetical protein